MEENTQHKPLRKGWTTGACATAASKAAFIGLVTGEFPEMIDVLLPRGERPFFSLASCELKEGYALVSVVKDAGDDPDVTHGAIIKAKVRKIEVGKGVVFKAGLGVGIVTKQGLALAVGEPAINPIPRDMMRTGIAEIAALYKVAGDLEIEISVPDGELLAEKTLNPRLGIMGGISILGTTGIVIPFSCSAWIHSIHRGIDVARAEGLSHIAGATGRTSEEAVQKLYALSDSALVDMGDFVGGMLKYIKKNPVGKVTIAGGVGKMTKLAQGLLDLHSRAGSVDLGFLAELSGMDEIRHANSAKHAFEIAPHLAPLIAKKAWETASKTMEGSGVEVEVILFDREGTLLARA